MATWSSPHEPEGRQPPCATTTHGSTRPTRWRRRRPLCSSGTPGWGMLRRLGIIEEPTPPGHFRDRRRLDAEVRHRPARPRGHATCLPDRGQSSARDEKSLPADKGWEHNQGPVHLTRTGLRALGNSPPEGVGCCKCGRIFRKHVPHYSCRMARGPPEDYATPSTKSRITARSARTSGGLLALTGRRSRMRQRKVRGPRWPDSAPRSGRPARRRAGQSQAGISKVDRSCPEDRPHPRSG